MLEISLSGIKCPHDRKKLTIVHDECDVKNGIIVGYCYNPEHPRLKLKTVTVKQFRSNSNQSCDMEGLKCFICGTKPWFNKQRSSVSKGITAYDCPKCKIEIRYLGKTVNTITYDVLFRVTISKSKRYEW